MTFQRIADLQPVIEYLTQTLTTHLNDGQRVTWLIPGGSAIAIAVAVSQQLGNVNTASLNVTLTDERFGPLNHDDSNWRQLMEAGFRQPDGLSLQVLGGKELPETVNDYGEVLLKLLTQSDFRIGLFGMGADGHTAGILPESAAVHDENYASGYDAGNFTRITMTPKAITRLSEAVVYAVGLEKQAALEGLAKENMSLDKQPAQVFKQLPKATIFNDQVGEG
jgi:6-phosphogluconolactonase/glucosamine-6-phosphate isomerase/deaminase